MIWSLGQKVGHSNKATKSRGTLGKEVHLGKKNNVATKCFGGLQLSAHPGDDLHDDPGAGLLEHGDRRRVGDALEALAVHCQQAVPAFQLAILKSGEVMNCFQLSILKCGEVMICFQLSILKLGEVIKFVIKSRFTAAMQEPWDDKKGHYIKMHQRHQRHMKQSPSMQDSRGNIIAS